MLWLLLVLLVSCVSYCDVIVTVAWMLVGCVSIVGCFPVVINCSVLNVDVQTMKAKIIDKL